MDYINIDRLFALLPHCPRLRSLSLVLDSRTSSANPEGNIPSDIFAQITSLRVCFRPFDASVLDRLLKSLPAIRRCSIETLVHNTDLMRSPFWTTLFQQHLPFLERIRLIVRGWFATKNSPQSTEVILDGTSVVDGYRYDRYWLDRTYKRTFQCHTDSFTAVLQIR